MCITDLKGNGDANHVIVLAPSIHDAIRVVRKKFGQCGSGMSIPPREPRDEEHFIDTAA
jgi:hypothetical protein